MISKLQTEKYTSLIEAVGELSNINGDLLIPQLSTVVPYILKAIQD